MSESFNTLKCPACQKDMKKVFIPKEGVNIDICLDGCGGMYFDNRELKYVDEQNESIDEILNSIQKKKFTPTDQNNHRTCPACGARMVKNFTSCKKQIQIDECYACGGKFLDSNELQILRAEYPTEEERSEDMIKLMYSTVGNQLKALEEDRAQAEAKRSLLKKLFDKMVMG